MQYITQKEAQAVRVLQNKESLGIQKLTEVEEKVKEVATLRLLPFSTESEKNIKQKAADTFLSELKMISNDNERVLERCRAAIFNEAKFNELMSFYPRVEAAVHSGTQLSPFAVMHLNGVEYHGLQRVVSWLLDVVKVCQKLPPVSAFVHTRQSWDAVHFKRLAETEENNAYYGIALPQELQQQVYTLTRCTPGLLFSYGMHAVTLAELCRRVRLPAPEGVSFNVRNVYFPRSSVILDIIRDNNGKPVTNSFIIG